MEAVLKYFADFESVYLSVCVAFSFFRKKCKPPPNKIYYYNYNSKRREFQELLLKSFEKC